MGDSVTETMDAAGMSHAASASSMTEAMTQVAETAFKLQDQVTCSMKEVSSTAALLKTQLSHTAYTAADLARTGVNKPRQAASSFMQSAADSPVPEFIYHAPLFLGIFVPAPQWPPAPLTLIAFLRAAIPIAAFAAIVFVALVGLWAVLVLTLPLLLLPAALASPLLMYAYQTRARSLQARAPRIS